MADPRLPGSGGSDFQESAAGSYSHALSMGSQAPPTGMAVSFGGTKPPIT